MCGKNIKENCRDLIILDDISLINIFVLLSDWRGNIMRCTHYIHHIKRNGEFCFNLIYLSCLDYASVVVVSGGWFTRDN